MKEEKVKIKTVRKSKVFGSSYIAEFSGKKGREEFEIEEYPPSQRNKDSAKYAVSVRYGNFIGKTRTLAGAKRLIKDVS